MAEHPLHTGSVIIRDDHVVPVMIYDPLVPGGEWTYWPPPDVVAQLEELVWLRSLQDSLWL